VAGSGRLALTAMADAALFLHLLGALRFVAGIIVAGVAHGAARRRHRASEVALLIGLARTGAFLVVAGAALVLAFGLWLVDLRGHSLGERWIAGALTLFALALVLGARARWAPSTPGPAPGGDTRAPRRRRQPRVGTSPRGPCLHCCELRRGSRRRRDPRSHGVAAELAATFELRRPGGEAAHDRAVGDVRDDRRQRRLAAVVDQHEPRRLKQRG
jgi:hypothetical protein